MDSSVKGGRKNGGVGEDEELPFCGQVLSTVDFRKEDEGGTKEGLEEFSGDASLKELSELSQHEELQDLELHGGKTVRPSLYGDSREGGGSGEVDASMRVVMIEPDIVVDKWGPFELLVLFDCEECNRVFEDHSIEIMGAIEGKAIETNRDDGGDGSHVQEGFERRPKTEGLIYPGNDPKWIKLNWQTEFHRTAGAKKQTVEKRRQLWWKDPCCGAAVEGRQQS